MRLINQIDYDFSVAEKKFRSLMQRFGALEAMRQCDLAWEVRDYLKTHPARRWSIWLRAGQHRQSLRQRQMQNLQSDFPDVIALRGSSCHPPGSGSKHSL